MRFALAPMDTLLRVMTWICYAIPLVLAASAWRAPGPAHALLLGTGLFIVVLYVFVWLWLRPRAFTITPEGLEISWPTRSRLVPAAAIVEARILTKRELREELGRIVRIGAGGLWGGFGRARTSQGMHELWVSRVDRMVWIRCVEGTRPLLVTPENPERFVAELTRVRSR